MSDSNNPKPIRRPWHGDMPEDEIMENAGWGECGLFEAWFADKISNFPACTSACEDGEVEDIVEVFLQNPFIGTALFCICCDLFDGVSVPTLAETSPPAAPYTTMGAIDTLNKAYGRKNLPIFENESRMIAWQKSMAYRAFDGMVASIRSLIAERDILRANPALGGKCTQCGAQGGGFEWLCHDCAENAGIPEKVSVPVDTPLVIGASVDEDKDVSFDPQHPMASHLPTMNTAATWMGANCYLCARKGLVCNTPARLAHAVCTKDLSKTNEADLTRTATGLCPEFVKDTGELNAPTPIGENNNE